MTKSALDLIAECFTAEEAHEATSFEAQSAEFAEFVETEVKFEQSIEEFEHNFLRTRRYAE